MLFPPYVQFIKFVGFADITYNDDNEDADATMTTMTKNSLTEDSTFCIKEKFETMRLLTSQI
ncbi:hypothetical protein V1478_010897 [Vespula squamosa]|uniref:Uncharacterized protein n=1 Tax=Vespula squamosa TaxID=30214 RepID=A0ABD2AIE9_VESSQ